MGAVNDALVDLVTVLRESVLAVDPFDFFAIEAQDEDTVGFEFELGVVLLLSDDSTPGDATDERAAVVAVLFTPDPLDDSRYFCDGRELVSPLTF